MIPHKVSKAVYATERDEEGRATKGHHSRWDLKLNIAASSSSLLLGVSVHFTHKGLLSLWWRPMCRGDDDAGIAREIFFDVREALSLAYDAPLRSLQDGSAAAQAAAESWSKAPPAAAPISKTRPSG